MYNHKSKMKPFDIKIERTNAILKYQRLQKLTTLFRFIEILIFMFMISNFSSQLPLITIKLLKDYFKGITFVLSSPKFVFVIGNMIILILFLKSRANENNECMGNNTDLSYEYVKNCHVVKSSTRITSTTTSTTNDVNNVANYSNVKKMCRSKSDNRIKVKCEEKQSYSEWRRSVTEKYGCDDGDMMVMEKRSVIKDELSCEDFRKTVEAFIARQQKILRDEEFSPMVYIGS